MALTYAVWDRDCYAAAPEDVEAGCYEWGFLSRHDAAEALWRIQNELALLGLDVDNEEFVIVATEEEG